MGRYTCPTILFHRRVAVTTWLIPIGLLHLPLSIYSCRSSEYWMLSHELALDNCYAHCMRAVSPPPEACRWSLSSWLAAALTRMAGGHCPVTL
jgi:hypothetical protein